MAKDCPVCGHATEEGQRLCKLHRLENELDYEFFLRRMEQVPEHA